MRFTFVKKHPISFLSSLYICNLFVSTLATATLPENEQVVLPPNAFEVSQSMGTLQSSQAGKPAYRAVAGFFIQDHPDTIKEDFNYMKDNFGLINRSYPTDEAFDPDGKFTQWQRFAYFVSHLNENTSPRTEYKVLFLGRHGEAWHNVAEAYYGHDDWEDYWSKQPGNATTNWTDPQLTPLGSKQAKVVHDFWLKQLNPDLEHMPAPEAFYVSPLTRCLETARLTFDGVLSVRSKRKTPESNPNSESTVRPFQPIVKEYLRETIGIHTCDKRSSQTWIREHYPNYRIEAKFTEIDELWAPDVRETAAMRDARALKLLDDLFGDGREKHTYVSLTCHGGIARSLLQALHHRPCRLETGEVVPILMTIDRAKEK